MTIMGSQAGLKGVRKAIVPCANVAEPVRANVGATSGSRSSSSGGHPADTKGSPVCNPPPFDAPWAASLSRKEKKQWIAYAMSEYEATVKNFAKLKSDADPKVIKMARRCGEHCKAILRVLGQTKKMPIIGKRKSKGNGKKGNQSQAPA